jgi:DNA modification methylase
LTNARAARHRQARTQATRSEGEFSQQPLSIQYFPVDSLHLDPVNPRAHAAKQIQQIGRSILSFGFNVPILIDQHRNVIAGHGRLFACKELGITEVPTISLAHLSAHQVKAYMIADNRLTENSSWNEILLAEQLRALASVELDFSLEATGFEMAEIDLRIENLEPSTPTAQDRADVVPEAEEFTVTKLGDWWKLGQHRLLCGDALDAVSHARLMGDQFASVVFADPPFNVVINGHATGLGKKQHREFAMACGEMSKAEFTEFLWKACTRLARSSQDGAIHFICMDWRHVGELLEAGLSAYDELKNICVWVKSNGGMGSLYRSQHEFIFVFKSGKAPHRNNIQLGEFGRYRTNIWNYAGANSFSRQTAEGNLLELHPTAKPVRLVADAILDVSARGEIVLDSFLGSGTTLIAAERMGRICYGMELDPQYVDTAVRRWQAFTSLEAEHGITGRKFNDLSVEVERELKQ